MKRGYPGIDRFRIIAALLVVAVHTAPLASVGELPDYLFTHVLARLAVPFFFAASGFFLLPGYAANKAAPARPVLRFVRKTALVYGAAILLYLPLNLYAGHFAGVQTPWQALNLLLFEGTVYHLWYLPAAILGMVLVWLLLRYAGAKAATAIAAALYLVGLLGDSYYGLAATAPPLQTFYTGLFAATGFTRNGLFFAPVFLLAGMWAAKWQSKPRAVSSAGLGICLVLLFAEGLLLYPSGWQRHDSMYLVLPATIFFLLVWLAGFAGASSEALRQVSLLVYLLHPYAIVLVRAAARLLNAGAVLVQNSPVHYAAVCALSLAAAAALAKLKSAFSASAVRRK